MTIVRAAGAADLEQVLAIADDRRRQYATYQPQFWNPSADAVDRQRDHFMSLRRDKDTLFAVAEVADRVQGFVIARLVPSPPVYEPGGTTCLVDDFTVADVQMWPEVGPLLLDRARASAADHGAAQLVVVTAGRDDAKRAVLHAGDLTAASERWVGAVSRTN